MKRQLRNLQTFFPFIRSAKFGAYNALAWYLRLRLRTQSEFCVLASYMAGGVVADIERPRRELVALLDDSMSLKAYRFYKGWLTRLDAAWNRAFNCVFLTDKHHTEMGL